MVKKSVELENLFLFRRKIKVYSKKFYRKELSYPRRINLVSFLKYIFDIRRFSMANYNYKRGYTVAELETLLVQVKAEREKYLQSASDSGSSYSRVALSEIEKKFNGIMDALELLAPEKYPKTDRRISLSGVVGGVIQ